MSNLKHAPIAAHLPSDLADALLVGRVWRAGDINGPCVVVVRNGEVFDVTASANTVSDLLDQKDVAGFVRSVQGESLGRVEALIETALSGNADAKATQLLAPCDVQAIKACGVTFAVSLLERVIEEQAGGDASRADELRTALLKDIGADLSSIKPGSPEAEKLKQQFIERGAWSQYMEVGIGPYAEVFSKSQPMSAVGFGADVGLVQQVGHGIGLRGDVEYLAVAHHHHARTVDVAGAPYAPYQQRVGQVGRQVGGGGRVLQLIAHDFSYVS